MTSRPRNVRRGTEGVGTATVLSKAFNQVRKFGHALHATKSNSKVCFYICYVTLTI